MSERVGVVNIAIEGQLLTGAFLAAVVGSLTDSLLLGLVAAMIGAAGYARAWGRVQAGEAMKRFNQKYDLLITPATAVPAFEVGRVMPDLPPGIRAGGFEWTWWTPFSFPFNLTQQPAMSVNCGFTAAGLPIGLQIVAPAYREDLALAAAAAFEGARGPVKWPDM